MQLPARNVAVLGATGSIGRSTLEVIGESAGRLHAYGLTAHRNLGQLQGQARQLRPQVVVCTDDDPARQVDPAAWPAGTQVLRGDEGLRQLVTDPAIDVVVTAIVGSAGLVGTWAALEAGKTIALANKETLVVAGPMVMQLAQENAAKILPVDSEHSAIFQCFSAGRREDVKRIVLTASGGPFRSHSKDQMRSVTVDDALTHPTWNMGPKITVDSATMMNKALEIIEARWLFDLDPDQIDVVIHPQSIVHSLVEFNDGSIIAQLSPPDMKLPIQYALTYPQRLASPAEKLDLNQSLQLSFDPPDEERFPSLALGHEVARAGGTAGVVLNAANEAAVASFLAGTLGFLEIVPACQTILNHHDYDPSPTLDQLLKLDAWAREEVSKCLCT